MAEDLAEVYPPFGLRIRCGDVLLRGITDDLLMPLVDVARRGIHDREEESNPFGFDWTAAPARYLAINFAQWAWRHRVNFTVDSFILALAVEYRGELAGVQEGKGERFRASRSLSTGSWLGRGFQGRGLGTLVRQVFCTFAVDHLGAVEVMSSAFTDNPASIRVSEKVGYQRMGERRALRGKHSATDEVLFRLTPETLVRPEAPLEVEGLEPLRRFLGLDGSPGGTATPSVG